MRGGIRGVRTVRGGRAVKIRKKGLEEGRDGGRGVNGRSRTIRRGRG